MVTLLAVYTLVCYFAPSLLGDKHRPEFWFVPFYVCWTIACWPQAVDRQFGIYCTLSRAERKGLPRTASYWIANLSATAAVAILTGAVLDIFWQHLR